MATLPHKTGACCLLIYHIHNFIPDPFELQEQRLKDLTLYFMWQPCSKGHISGLTQHLYKTRPTPSSLETVPSSRLVKFFNSSYFCQKQKYTILERT